MGSQLLCQSEIELDGRPSSCRGRRARVNKLKQSVGIYAKLGKIFQRHPGLVNKCRQRFRESVHCDENALNIVKLFASPS